MRNKRNIFSAALVLVLLAVLLIVPAFAEANVTEVATYDALTAALANGGEIKLTADIFYSNGYNDGKTLKIEAGKDVTLDLNGHTLGQTVVDNGASVAAIAVRAGAVLTVKDSSAEQTGKISACNTAVQLEGTLNLQSGTIAVDNPSAYDANPETGFSFGVWCYMRSDEAVGPVFNMTGGAIDIRDDLLTTHAGYNFANAVACGDGASGVLARYEKASVSITAGTVDGTLVVGQGTAVTAPEEIPVYCIASDGYAVDAVAALMNTDGAKKMYSTLQAAINAAQDGDTVEILADQILTAQHVIEKDITVNGNGFELTTSTVQRLIWVKADVTIRDLTVTNTYSGGRCIETRVGGITLNLNNVTLTAANGSTQALTVGGNAGTDGDVVIDLNGCHIDSGAVGYGIITFNPVKLTIENSTAVCGYGALYLKPADSSVGSAGSVVEIKESTLSSLGRDDGYAFGTVVIQDNDITVNVDEKSALIATNPENSTGRQYAVLIQNVDKVGDPAVYTGVTVSVAGKLESSYLLSNLTSLENTVYVPAQYKDAIEAFTTYKYFTTAADNGQIRVWAAHTHALKQTPAVKETYTTAGNTAYYTCSVCGEWFADAAGTQRIADRASVIVPAKNSGELLLNVSKQIQQTGTSYYLFTPGESGVYLLKSVDSTGIYPYMVYDTQTDKSFLETMSSYDEETKASGYFYEMEAGKTYAIRVNGTGKGTYVMERPVAPTAIRLELNFEKATKNDYLSWQAPLINYISLYPFNAYANLEEEVVVTTSDEKIVALSGSDVWSTMEPLSYGKATITVKLGDLTASDTVEVISHPSLVPGEPNTADDVWPSFRVFTPQHSGTYILTVKIGEGGAQILCYGKEEPLLNETFDSVTTQTYKLELEAGTEYTFEAYFDDPPVFTLGTEHVLTKVEAKAATCIEDGCLEHYFCAACNKVFVGEELTETTLEKVTVKGDHKIVHVAAKDKTCTENGVREHWYCEFCSNGKVSMNEELTKLVDGEEVVIPAGHRAKPVEAKAATCTEAGNVAHYLCDCGYIAVVDGEKLKEVTVKDIIVLAKGHTMTKVETVTPTCTGDGNVEYYNCSVCKKNFADEKGEKELSSVVEAAKGHKLTKVEAKAATCTEDGVIAHYTCSGCKKNFADEKGEKELTTVAEAAKGHKLTKVEAKAATCTEDGVIAHYTCSGCKKNFADEKAAKELTTVAEAAKGHKLTKVEAKAATYTEAGNIEHYACACGKLFADEKGEKEITDVVIPQLIKVEEEKAEVSKDAVDNAIADAKEKAEATGKPVEVVIEVPKAPVVEKPEDTDKPEQPEQKPQEVVKVELPVQALENVAKEEANLTVVMPSVTVTMDTNALQSVTEQAAGNTVTLVVEQVKEETLTEKQQEVVSKYDVAVTIKAEFICQETQEKIWTENSNADKEQSGSVTVKMPFTPPQGTKGTDYQVLYIADDGSVKEIRTAFEDGHLVFALEHFSEYVVVNTASINDIPKTDDPTMLDPFLLLLVLSFAGVAVLVAGKKKLL